MSSCKKYPPPHLTLYEEILRVERLTEQQLSLEDICRVVGQIQSWVVYTIRFRRHLPEEVFDAIKRGHMNRAVASVLLMNPDLWDLLKSDGNEGDIMAGTMMDALFDVFDKDDEYITPLWMQEQNDAYQASKILWNPWLFKVLDAASGMPWIVGGSMPANTAIRHQFENADNYFAISGDGLLSLLFEVLSFEGEGRVRYHVLYETHFEEVRKMYATFSKWKPGDPYPSIYGPLMYARGVCHNDEMTFPELIEHLEGCVETRTREMQKLCG